MVADATQTVPGADHAGVLSLSRDGAVTSYASSSDPVARIDRVQAQSRQGPGVTALWEHHTVLVDDLAAEADRWPAFASGAASTVSFPLSTSDDTLGALYLYSVPQAGLDQQVLLTRDVIGQAKGILAERFGIGAAAGLLVGAQLVDVARWLVAGGGSRAAAPGEAVPPEGI
ncbi:GAF and ANTAR domain-containing protein [Amycolatopsis rubida]|uniref:GAF and ANTAR domain-containing protein n=1 Tax=Amycolatopsis rubida TaxID=112413 RepID=A0ABX0BR99_9PSEU|nr:hypothetical protein [Amycolatopsis rubida]NEC55391.1 GAF and ANTAR domain-containing protein [Amycolatopsis rubida]